MTPNWKLSTRSSSLEASATLAIDARVKELIKQGVDIVSFGVGEPDFDTPIAICEAGIQAIRNGKTRYTPAGGVPELRAAIAEKLKRENGLEYSPQEVLACAGTKQALHNSFQVLLSPGDEVLVLAPYWVSYSELIKLSEGKPVFIPCDAQGRPVKEKFEQAIGPRTVGILINSPNNPAGTVYTQKEIESLVELALQRGLWILSDEVYEKFVFGDAKHFSPAAISKQAKSRTIVVNAVSKTFAMTGWRLGYMAGPREIIQVAENIQSHSTGNPSDPAQYAALAALTGNTDSVEAMRQEYDRRRLRILELLGKIPGIQCSVPQGAFYVYPKVESLFSKTWRGEPIANSMRLAQLLLEEAKIAVVPGSAFGTEGYLRFSYACSMKQLEKGMERMQQWLAQL